MKMVFTFQIRTSTKRPPNPRQHADAQTRFRIQPLPHCVQLGVALGVDAV